MRDRILTIVLSVATTLGVVEVTPPPQKELTVERLIVTKELIVSDTGEIWKAGYEKQQIPRGIYAKSLGDGPGGLWVRSRLIKGEVDDPFDDRFHAIERDGSLRTAPGHISWNVWLDDNWRQLAIIQGEGMEFSEVPRDQWNGGTHPGRIRFQTYRPGHDEPLTDAIIGQGKMSLGGGGYGGGGLPAPKDVLHLWGGGLRSEIIAAPVAPVITKDDGTGEHRYAIVGVGVQGRRSEASKETVARGVATLQWDSVAGADAYYVLRDGKEIAGPLRIEGSQKIWADNIAP
ncbi:MAG: hypothetical protein IT366_02025 [Candidatus Hydrogenedentes bacterium]|nr:hypothetical protein [Candidatus Hydrogenedentota bacterium]